MESNTSVEQEVELFQLFRASTERYLQQLGLGSIEQIQATATEGKHKLEDVTAFIQISGAMQGGFLFTVEEGLSRCIARKFMIESITDIEAAQYAAEVVAEVANVITGNALTDRELRDIFLGNPLMILTTKAEIRAKCKRSYVQAYGSQDGSFRLIYIPMEHKAELASILAVHLD